jgi:hypothetical protein
MAKNPVGGFWARLTPRERVYILVLVLTFFVMGTAVLVYMRGNAIRRAEDEITAVKQALDQVYTRGSVYEQRLEEKKKRESTLSTKTLASGTLVEEASKVSEAVSVSSEEELPAIELSDGLVKRSYKFSLRAVSLEDLVKFLVRVESKPGHVILTENLLIRSPSRSEDRLNADVTIATYERRVAEEEEGGEDGEEEDGGATGRDVKRGSEEEDQ